MEEKHDKSSNSVTDIAADGDIILVVGPERRKLRVHSLILKNVSTAFNAMFGPHFKEGQGLGGACPKEIPLPGDSADALELICCVIHSRNDAVPDPPSSSAVLQVAIAADKYDCAVGLKFAGESWLTYYDVKNTVELGRLMAAAYIFDSVHAFWKITLELIFHHEGSYLKLVDEDTRHAIPSTIFCLLEERRSMIRTELGQILLEVLASSEYINTSCNCVALQAFSWMKLLRDQGLWPAKIVNVSISAAIKKAEVVSNSVPGSQHSTSCCYTKSQNDNKQKERLAHKMDIIKNRGGLCLDCVRMGRNAGTKECRIKH